MLQIQYQIHKILNSEYKLFFTLLIYFIIYFSFNSSNIAYCMMENDIPEIAEAKPNVRPKIELTNLEKLIHRNIDSYIGDKDLIRSQQEEITRLQKELAYRNEYDMLVLGNDGVSDAIANGGLHPYINKLCREHGRPLDYPWIDENGNYRDSDDF